MSDRIALLPSLPPEISGKIQGVLRIEIGVVEESTQDASSFLFRLSFWGEKSPGIVLRSLSSNRESVANEVTYSVKCSSSLFNRYLQDMEFLTFEVLSTDWKPFGVLKIGIKNYPDLNINDFFPISSNNTTIAMVKINTNLDFSATENKSISKIQARAERLKQKMQEEIETTKPMTEINLKITTLTIFIDRNKLRGKNIYIEVAGSKISHKGGYDNIYMFDHEGKIKTEENGNIEFILKASDDMYRELELGRTSVMQEHVKLAPNSCLSVVLELKYQNALIGRLSTQLAMPGSLSQAQPVDSVHISSSPTISKPKKELEVFTEEPEGPLRSPLSKNFSFYNTTPRSFQLYLFIDHLSQLAESRAYNLFISYKSFPDGEKVTTPVMWEYKEGDLVNHSMLVPVNDSETMVSKLLKGIIVLEVWDKANSSRDQLLGLVKLPLSPFGFALRPTGDLVTNNEFHPIVFEDYWPVANLRTGQDIGRLKVCLAMGTAMQIHKIQSTQKKMASSKEFIGKQSIVKESIDRSFGKTDVITTPHRQSTSKNSLAIDNETNSWIHRSQLSKTDINNSPMPKSRESPVLEKKEDYLIDRMGSPGIQLRESRSSKELFRNQWDLYKPESPKYYPMQVDQSKDIREHFHPEMLDKNEIKEDSGEELNEDEFDIGNIASFLNANHDKEEVKVPEYKPEVPETIEITEEETVEKIMEALASRSINLEEELLKTDRFSYGYLHSDSLLSLLLDLDLGLPERVLEKFIDIVISQSEISTNRRVLISDILSSISTSENVKHVFSVSIREIYGFLYQSQIFLKYLFPSETSYKESDMLLKNERQQLDIENDHTFILPKSTILSKAFDLESPGIQFELCRKISICEDETIGKGFLPLEELIDMENQDSFARVICLLGSNNEIQGKIKIRISYNSSITYENIPEPIVENKNIVSIEIKKIVDLKRAERYMREIGYALFNMEIYIQISLFHEDPDLLQTYKPIKLPNRLCSEEILYNQREKLTVTMTERAIKYMNESCGLIELIGVLSKSDEMLIGFAKPKLLPLVTSSKMAGEFPLLNEYGQFMGCVSMSFNEKTPPPTPSLQSEIEFEEIVQEVYVPIELYIETAMYCSDHIKSPNLYVSFQWFDGQTYQTPPILRSSYPAWNAHFQLNLPVGKVKKQLEMNIMHKSFERNDESLGHCSILLELLSERKEISGWYTILSNDKQSGQLKVKIISTETVDFGSREIEKTNEEIFAKEIEENYRDKIFKSELKEKDSIIIDKKNEIEIYGEINQNSYKEIESAPIKEICTDKILENYKSSNSDKLLQEESIPEKNLEYKYSDISQTSPKHISGLMDQYEKQAIDIAQRLDTEEDDEILRKHRENMKMLDSICKKISLNPEMKEEPNSESYQPDDLKTEKFNPSVLTKPESELFNPVFEPKDLKSITETHEEVISGLSIREDSQIHAEKSVIDKSIDFLENQDLWLNFKADDILRTIQEASNYSPRKDPLDSFNYSANNPETLFKEDSYLFSSSLINQNLETSQQLSTDNLYNIPNTSTTNNAPNLVTTIPEFDLQDTNSPSKNPGNYLKSYDKNLESIHDYPEIRHDRVQNTPRNHSYIASTDLQAHQDFVHTEASHWKYASPNVDSQQYNPDSKSHFYNNLKDSPRIPEVHSSTLESPKETTPIDPIKEIETSSKVPPRSTDRSQLLDRFASIPSLQSKPFSFRPPELPKGLSRTPRIDTSLRKSPKNPLPQAKLSNSEISRIASIFNKKS